MISFSLPATPGIEFDERREKILRIFNRSETLDPLLEICKNILFARKHRGAREATRRDERAALKRVREIRSKNIFRAVRDARARERVQAEREIICVISDI